MATLQTAGGFTTGIASTVATRQLLDDPQSSSVMRPSVLLGVGGGIAALGYSTLIERGRVQAPIMNRRTFTAFLDAHGAASAASGLMSMFYPRGSTDIQTPSLG